MLKLLIRQTVTVSTFDPSVDIRQAGLLAGMSICLVGINYAPDSTGIAPYTEAMANSFRDAGAEVHVITGVPHYPQWKLKDSRYAKGSKWEESVNGVRVTRLSHHVPAIQSLLGRARMELSFLTGAIPTIFADRSDVVIAVTPSLAGITAAAIARRRRPLGALVQDLTGNAAGESGTTGNRVSRAIAAFEYFLLRKANLVGIITPQFGEVLVTNGVNLAALVDLPNFTHITPVSSTKGDARNRLGWPTENFTVVHTGNMGMKQGLESVVDAARLSEQRGLGINFALVGDGNQRPTLQALGAGLSTLRFVDPLSQVDYPFALAAADLLLINERPGVKEMSLPSKLTSYASAGRPILAAVQHGGITHQVLEASCAALTTMPGNADALLQAISTLRTKDASARYTSAANELYHSNYSAESARTRYVNFAALLRDGNQ